MQSVNRKRIQSDCSSEKHGDKAVQQFKKHCDINEIMKKVKKTGSLEGQQIRKGTYMNLAGIGNLFEIQQVVTQAENAFNALPSDIRKQFGNKAANLAQYANDPKNYESLVQMGLAEAKPALQQSSTTDTHSTSSGGSDSGKQEPEASASAV